MGKYENLSFEKINHTGVITLRRGSVMNALNREITLEFHSVLEALPEMFPEVRVVVITGEGRGFCSGADVNGMNPIDRQSTADFPQPIRKPTGWLTLALRSFPHPTI